MKRFCRHTVSALLTSLIFVVNLASAAIITFDDINISPIQNYYSESLIQNGYQGFNWSRFGVVNGSIAPYSASGYGNGMLSAPNVAFNWTGDAASFSSATPFSLNNASFTGAWNDGLQIHAVANGANTYTKDFTVSTNSPTNISFNWSNINSVTFSSGGGTPNIALSGGGNHFVMDNLVVNETPTQPKSYGLFIGAKDYADFPHIVDFSFDQSAVRLAAAFDSRPNTETFVLAGDVRTNPITREKISNKLSQIKQLMTNPEDTLTIYISDHGGSLKPGDTTFNDNGMGDEAIYVGDLLYDNELANMLSGFAGFRKTVFLDSCHGGGFWGSNDPWEKLISGGKGESDLDQLDNIALYSGASEWRNEYLGLIFNNSFWGAALEEAFLTPVSWSGQGLADFLDSRTPDVAYSQNDPVYYSLGLGDSVPADPSLIQPFHAHSADFDMNVPMFSSVPEPSTLTLLGLGIAGLAWCRRRQSQFYRPTPGVILQQ